MQLVVDKFPNQIGGMTGHFFIEYRWEIKEDFMILADKIINLRKKESMTQEDLAAKIGVSRQSVSKWESTMAMPDLDKIVKLSQIFGVSTDFLLDDKLGMEAIIVEDSVSESNVKTIDSEMLNDYLKIYDKIAVNVGLAISLLVSSPIPSTLLNNPIGSILTLSFVALAVGLFLISGFSSQKYDFIEKEPYDFSYGIEGVINKNMDEYKPIVSRNVIISIAIFILSPLIIMIFENNINDDILTSIFLFIISLGAYIISHTMVKNSAFQDLLKYRNPKEQIRDNRLAKASGILWVLAIGLVIILGYQTGNWEKSWIPIIAAIVIQISMVIFFD